MKLMRFRSWLLFFLLASVVHSQDSNKVYLFNPDYHVAKELSIRRIVMLGDYGHHTPSSLHSLIKVLNAWIEQSKSDNANRHLSLILETDEEDGNRINTYIRDGNLDTVLNYRGAM